MALLHPNDLLFARLQVTDLTISAFYRYSSQQPKLTLLPEGQRGGTRFLDELEDGAQGRGYRGQGHFQDRARQLTSPANWKGDPLGPRSRGPHGLPVKDAWDDGRR